MMPASILGELFATGLALLGELGDAGDGDAEELEDDGGVDVGHDAEGKDGELAEGAAGEGVQEVEQSARDHAGGRLGEDVGSGDVAADDEDGEHREDEEDAPTEVGELEGSDDWAEGAGHFRSPPRFLRRPRSWRGPPR